MITVDDLSKVLRDLLRQVFVHNCQIENSKISPEEDKDIECLPVTEVIENLKEILYNLLQFKQDYIETDVAEANKRSEQFEKMLQKSEAEVRSHIRTENQLKLLIETNQTQIEELEKQNSKSGIEVKKLQEKLKALYRLKNDAVLVEKVQILEENLKDKEKVIEKLENEIRATKVGFLRNDTDKLVIMKSKEKTEEVKHRIIDGIGNISKVKKFVNEKPMRPLRDRGIRKSAVENDLTRNIIYDKTSIKTEKAHFRSTSENIRPKSVTRRLPSR